PIQTKQVFDSVPKKTNAPDWIRQIEFSEELIHRMSRHNRRCPSLRRRVFAMIYVTKPSPGAREAPIYGEVVGLVTEPRAARNHSCQIVSNRGNFETMICCVAAPFPFDHVVQIQVRPIVVA